MPTTIRLQRGGRRNAPYYRVVVVDSRTRSQGRVIDEIGYYHPCGRPEPRTEIERDKALSWLAKGARPSATVRNLLSKQGILAASAQAPAAPDAETGETGETPA